MQRTLGDGQKLKHVFAIENVSYFLEWFLSLALILSAANTHIQRAQDPKNGGYSSEWESLLKSTEADLKK